MTETEDKTSTPSYTYLGRDRWREDATGEEIDGEKLRHIPRTWRRVFAEFAGEEEDAPAL